MKKKSIIAMSALTVGALALAGCTNADVASRNLSKEADHFEVQRHIVGVNGITNEFAFEVVGDAQSLTTGTSSKSPASTGPTNTASTSSACQITRSTWPSRRNPST